MNPADIAFIDRITGDIHPVANFNGNGMTAYRTDYERRCERADRLALASDELADEFVTAFAAGPFSTVRTPGGPLPRETVASIVYDSFADATKGERLLGEVLNVMRLAIKSQDPAVRLPAQAWLASFSRAHGDWHAPEWASRED